MDKLEKRKRIKKQFNAQDDIWKIEAVIHDGNWYDPEKWAKVAKVDKKTLLAWIEDNKDILIESGLGSYRVGYDEIIRWYEQEGIDVEESIVPSNFPPKLWGGTTETDVFSNAPRRRVGTISFKVDNNEILDRCVEILKGVGKVMPDEEGRYRAYGLSAIHMKNLLSKGLTESEFESLDIKTRAILLQRELVDLPPEWLSEAITFYANIFAPSILKSAMPTISIYLPNKEDIHSQIVIWVITAMKKFDENASVPFSGYLSSVLRHWPYDLPNEFLGKDLAKFQRERKKAIELIKKEGYKGDNISIETLAEKMDIPKNEYIELNSEHENWLAEKNATTLTWEDSANEKKGELLGSEAAVKNDVEKMATISLAAVRAGIETKDWGPMIAVISQIDKSDIDKDINEKLSSEFLVSFAKNLGLKY
jgi:hypothetical protein